MSDTWAFEKQAGARGCARIAGVDEAGRGPLAGPVVAAAVTLNPDVSWDGVTDSKKLTPARRKALYDFIRAHADGVGVGIVEAPEIDRINILQASLTAMALAVADLDPPPDYLLIDGTFGISSPIAQEAIPKGDALSISISAASVIAKETRDRIMRRYDAAYPQYGFAAHKGYPTKSHRNAVRTFGPCPIHRRSFKGVREYL